VEAGRWGSWKRPPLMGVAEEALVQHGHTREVSLLSEKD